MRERCAADPGEIHGGGCQRVLQKSQQVFSIDAAADSIGRPRPDRFLAN
jgi:hypothetical protein